MKFSNVPFYLFIKHLHGYWNEEHVTDVRHQTIVAHPYSSLKSSRLSFLYHIMTSIGHWALGSVLQNNNNNNGLTL